MHSMRTNCILYNGTRKVRQRPRIRIVSGLCVAGRVRSRGRAASATTQQAMKPRRSGS